MAAEAQGALETYTCPNCGATTSFDPGSQTLRCPFCGAELAVRATAAAAGDTGVPRYVLPFKVLKDDSQEHIRHWLGSSFWAPGDLKNRSALDRGQGAYVPFWRFDADAQSTWEGEISQTHTRQVPRTRTTSDGKSEQYMASESYQTWHPRSGTHSGHHRAWVPGSTGLQHGEADNLMPFPEEAMMTYSPDLLVGFSAEEPGVDEKGAWVNGEQRIREMERAACAREVERLTRAETALSNIQTALCYLPIWIYGYDYQNQSYRVLVNGHTGEIVGDRPVSKARIGVAAGVGIAVVLIVIVLILIFR